MTNETKNVENFGFTYESRNLKFLYLMYVHLCSRKKGFSNSNFCNAKRKIIIEYHDEKEFKRFKTTTEILNFPSL